MLLTGSICHCSFSPSEWRTALSTRVSPPMTITVPTTAGGNSERMRVISGATQNVTPQYTSAIIAMPPGPTAISVVVTNEITNGLGMCAMRKPLPQRPPHDCSAVQTAMPIKVMASMGCVPAASSPAARVATST